MSTPLQILRQAEETLAVRGVDYGDHRQNFGRIRRIWEAILGHPLTEQQVAACLVGLKLARLGETPDHPDSWLDIVGYGALGASLGPAPKQDPDNIGEV